MSYSNCPTLMHTLIYIDKYMQGLLVGSLEDWRFIWLSDHDEYMIMIPHSMELWACIGLVCEFWLLRALRAVDVGFDYRVVWNNTMLQQVLENSHVLPCTDEILDFFIFLPETSLKLQRFTEIDMLQSVFSRHIWNFVVVWLLVVLTA